MLLARNASTRVDGLRLVVAYAFSNNTPTRVECLQGSDLHLDFYSSNVVADITLGGIWVAVVRVLL